MPDPDTCLRNVTLFMGSIDATPAPRRLGDDTPGQGCLYANAQLISTTRAQQNFVVEVPLEGGGLAFVWTGDRWQQ